VILARPAGTRRWSGRNVLDTMAQPTTASPPWFDDDDWPTHTSQQQVRNEPLCPWLCRLLRA